MTEFGFQCDSFLGSAGCLLVKAPFEEVCRVLAPCLQALTPEFEQRAQIATSLRDRCGIETTVFQFDGVEWSGLLFFWDNEAAQWVHAISAQLVEVPCIYVVHDDVSSWTRYAMISGEKVIEEFQYGYDDGFDIEDDATTSSSTVGTKWHLEARTRDGNLCLFRSEIRSATEEDVSDAWGFLNELVAGHKAFFPSLEILNKIEELDDVKFLNSALYTPLNTESP